MKKTVATVVASILFLLVFLIYLNLGPTGSGDDQEVPLKSIDRLSIDGGSPTPAQDRSAGRPRTRLLTSSFQEIKNEALSGSASAQRKLSEFYDNCMAYSLNPTAWLQTLDAMAAVNPTEKNNIEKVKGNYVARCNEVDNGEPIPSDASKLWLERAAEGGDAAAKLRLRLLSPKSLTGEEAGEYIVATVNSRDPAAMIVLSELLVRPLESDLPPEYANLAGSPILGAAWGVAACRMGAACADGTALMDGICSFTGRCGYSSYADYLTSEQVPAGQMAEFDQTVRTILRLYNK